MAEKLTPQQLQAVTDRGGKLLVSAAAGSGKTKVLVDRIMGYLTDPVDPANIDEFLIITYTKAAASELRAKIAAKLTDLIAQDPQNRHLQQQMQRMYMTQISTVHSFCTELLRGYAYRLNIAGDFRVAEENECTELQARVLDQLLNEAYENAANDPDFCALVDTQGLGRDDRQIPKIVLKLYKNAKCHLDPEGWLDWCLQIGDQSGVYDASQTVWGKYLIDDLHRCLDMQISALNRCIRLADATEGFDGPATLLRDTVWQLETLRGCDLWDDVFAHMHIDYGRMDFPKGRSNSDEAMRIKAVREHCKLSLQKKFRKFSDNSEQICRDLSDIRASTNGLVYLTRRFIEAYDKAKRSRRILDFADLEHMSLDLLLGKSRSGPTAIAREVSKRYRQVMVDEYQDSNQVQDAIFGAITVDNCFMVGDVKQSIYQFRLADPSIFLNKYEKYLPAEQARPGQDRKVLLSSNFRSAGNVIEAVNDVFTKCMSPQVGGLSYGKDEALEEGIPHAPVDEPEVELYAIQAKESTNKEEAAFVAQRIAQLLDGSHMIRDKQGLRPIRLNDIVILLRSPGSTGKYYVRALENIGIRCSSANADNLLETEEVQSIRSILQTIDNPLQDIPLVAALTSRTFGFTADDLARIRSEDRDCSMYTLLRKSQDEKARHFVGLLDGLRVQARMSSLPKLMNHIISVTRMDSIFAAMPDGKNRTENLQKFCQLAVSFESGGAKDLSRFLKHLQILDEKGIATEGDTAAMDAVTVLSIHKSKGLEFPVVFLCGLSRDFNRDSIRAQVLCDKELGIGLACVDSVNRVRYPSVAKRAIAAKMTAQSISEEMRVLYVAMTRPKDRLIMTYAAQNLKKELTELVCRMDCSDSELMTADVDCPGKWILYSALKRSEAGALFALGGYPEDKKVKDNPWLIKVVEAPDVSAGGVAAYVSTAEKVPEASVDSIRAALNFRYSHIPATVAPSKQTATQLKGREKDEEVSGNAAQNVAYKRAFRKPSFVDQVHSGRAYGNAVHSVMQHIRFDACSSIEGVRLEISRLAAEDYITQDEASFVDAGSIARFFETQIGRKLISGDQVLREFKFSVLEDGGKYDPNIAGEKILLQGVVDCALIEPDGITVIDFKTDRVTEDSFHALVDHYRPQVTVYADALSRIYQLPIKSTQLYFFRIGKFAVM